jgi:arylsulfatase A-like enzyme
LRPISTWPLAAVALVGLAGLASAQTDNLLIVVADDVGVDAVSCYAEGVDPPDTPTIDMLAASGVLFRNAWANPTCSPTRAEFVTGRYGFRTGLGMIVSHTGWYLQPEEVTFPEVLDRLGTGHTCGWIGKWHLSNSQFGYLDGPLLQGFDRFTGARENIRVNQGYHYEKWPRVANGVESVCTTYATTQQVDDALDFMRTAPQPWVCVLAFNAPHEPFHRPPQHLFQRVLPPGDPRLDPPPFYKAAVEAMDAELARLYFEMGQLVADTNIVFTADNGTPKLASEAPFLPAHAKLTPYEGGLNVPLIVKGPIVGEPGREVGALVAAPDLFATVLELCGVTDPGVLTPGRGHDSHSLVPYLTSSGAAPVRTTVYAEMFSPNGPGGNLADADVRAIRNARFKLIRRGLIGGPYTYEFYDLDLDPFETNDLVVAGNWGRVQTSAFVSLLNELTALTN